MKGQPLQWKSFKKYAMIEIIIDDTLENDNINLIMQKRKDNYEKRYGQAIGQRDYALF